MKYNRHFVIQGTQLTSRLSMNRDLVYGYSVHVKTYINLFEVVILA